MNRELDNFKKLKDVLKELPLGEDGYIGIYGTGLHTEHLLQRYQADVGEIKAKLIFIDSYKQTLSDRYKDCDIYNVHDIGKLSLDAVIISSFLYEKEMYQMLKELYENRFLIYRFYEWGLEEIFDIGGMYLKPQKILRVNFADFWSDFKKDHNFILNALFGRYMIELSDEPDIVFCSHFGKAHKNYKNCIKIFIETEVMPYDVKDYDYVVGFKYLKGERFCHYNIYAPKGISNIQDRSRFSDLDFARRKFCNFIYSNDSWGEGAVIRKQFCIELGGYKHIDCPGKVLNNMKNVITSRESAEWSSSKLAFIGQYKFTIAFENHMSDGYTTEKLWGPLSAGSIPIYWGNRLISKEVDRESFIDCNEFDNDFEAVIERVKEVDADEEYYMYMIQKAPLRNGFDSGYGNFKFFWIELFQKFSK